MDRAEALRALGLGEEATADDIKIAYRETAQILHPDRFAGNKKLQERATEQFKNLQEAYDLLSKGRAAPSSAKTRAVYGRVQEVHARLAGIAAARVQLQEQRDSFIDRRKTGLGMLAGGLFVALLARRIVWLAGIAGAVAFWGGFDAYTAHRSIEALTKQLNHLTKEKKQLLAELEEME
ncbi:J domain-containing protein [Curtanaerobium respiraculi]|uniref:J domain-containing protein n=1 Tax=Curtanaerobium respiraculi TaxID=2949669 RepID=UPI0024B328AD|nr:DnaJ domain-containing protein [Curtanaerobium respiraculi]